MGIKEIKNIIAVGTSAGGLSAVSRMLSFFPASLDAAVFVVIHFSRNSMSDVVLKIIQKHTSLDCQIPVDGAPIENGVLYLAPADYHMIINKRSITVQKGAYENHWRPSIDVLFRSAAATYSSCVIGIILTGLLDDGTSGMSAIKRAGGICMVQEPREAEFSDMPQNVLNNIEVDYRVSIEDMGYILTDIFSRDECESREAPEEVKLEADITKRMNTDMDELRKISTLSPFTCPDCGGTLGQVKNEAHTRYRCYTGHSFTEQTLEDRQAKELEEALWVAIRMMEERRNLLTGIANRVKERNPGLKNLVQEERAEGMKVHIERLKAALLEIGKNTDKLTFND